MQTLPSIEAVAQVFACQPRIGAEHPDYGVLTYEVEFETEHERVSLSVLPVAEEVNFSLFTKQPPRFVRLGLKDVSKVLVVKTDEDGEMDEKVEIHFHCTEAQTLTLRLRPVFVLIWGNQPDLPERHPPWERD